MPASAPASAPTAVPAASVSADTAATLDEVALRMSRIKASAAAIREAIEVEAQRASVGASAPAPAPARAPAPTTVHEPRAAANDVRDDDDDLDAELDAILPGRDSSGPVGFEPRLPPRREAGADRGLASGLEQDFLGGDDDFDDGDEIDGDHGVAAFAPAARPFPWRPILIAAGAMVAIGAFVFRDQIFGTSTPTDTNIAEVRSGAVVADEKNGEPKPVKAEPAPAPVDPAAGKPVTPEPTAVAGAPTPAPGTPSAATPTLGAATPTPGAATPAPGAPPTPTPGAATPAVPRATPDADTSARLDEARSLYVAAKGGSQRKKLGEARKLLQEILVTAPAQADALLLLSQIELELGHADAALSTAQQCTQAAAELADCWLTIGVLQQDRRKKAEATLAYEKYLALAPDGRYAGDVRSQLKRLKK